MTIGQINKLSLYSLYFIIGHLTSYIMYVALEFYPSAFEHYTREIVYNSLKLSAARLTSLYYSLKNMKYLCLWHDSCIIFQLFLCTFIFRLRSMNTPLKMSCPCQTHVQCRHTTYTLKTMSDTPKTVSDTPCDMYCCVCTSYRL